MPSCIEYKLQHDTEAQGSIVKRCSVSSQKRFDSMLGCVQLIIILYKVLDWEKASINKYFT